MWKYHFCEPCLRSHSIIWAMVILGVDEQASSERVEKRSYLGGNRAFARQWVRGRPRAIQDRPMNSPPRLAYATEGSVGRRTGAGRRWPPYRWHTSVLPSHTRFRPPAGYPLPPFRPRWGLVFWCNRHASNAFRRQVCSAQHLQLVHASEASVYCDLNGVIAEPQGPFTVH